MTPEEKEILQRLSAKAQRYQASSHASTNSVKNPQQTALEKSLQSVRTSSNGQPSDEEDDVLPTDIYAANLSLLKKD